MKKLLLAVAALFCLTVGANAQCGGVFPSGAVCGNPTGTSAPPKATTAIPGTSSTFIQAGTGAVTRTMQDKARERVSVIDYSNAANAAVCAGNDAVDDSVAINKAAVYINSIGGGEVYFPAGSDCRLKNPIVPLAGVQFVGQGNLSPVAFSASVIQPSANLSALFLQADLTTPLSDFGIHGLTLYGRKSTYTVTNMVHVSAINSTIERSNITYGSGNCVQWDANSSYTWINYIHDNAIGTCDGFALSFVGSDSFIANNEFGGGGSGNVYLRGAGANIFTGNKVETSSAGQGGLTIQSPTGATGQPCVNNTTANVIVGNIFEANNVGVYFQKGACAGSATSSDVVSGNVFIVNSVRDIQTDSGILDAHIGPNNHTKSSPSASYLGFIPGTTNTGWTFEGTVGSSTLYENKPASTKVDVNGAQQVFIRSTGTFSGALTSSLATASASNSTGAVLLSGGLASSNTSDAISATNGGTITTAGGAAIGKKLFVGTSVTAPNLIASGPNGFSTALWNMVDSSGDLVFYNGTNRLVLGATGLITTGTWSATKIGLAYGGLNADSTLTGGTSQFLKQNTLGGAIVPTRPTCNDLSDAGACANTGAALTKTDDTNVTLTLGGTPATALLQGVSLTLGWTGGLANSRLATMATNTVKGNATSGAATPTDLSVGTCSTSASALQWTTNTGFSCNTSINAATLGGATFASPGAIGGGTASTGAFTTASATTFTGALSGNATTATTATNATNGTTVATSSNASFFPLFAASSSNSNQPFNLDTTFSYNPSTDTLAFAKFASNVSAGGDWATVGSWTMNYGGAGEWILYNSGNKMTLTSSGGVTFAAGVTATGYTAGASAGLSTTKTVRASGGASDCTLIFTGGLLTGGSC